MSSTCPALNGVQVIIFVILSIRRHGNGKYQDTEEVFEGVWKHDAKEGYGTSKLISGGRYQGQWKHGAEDGNGKRLYPDG